LYLRINRMKTKQHKRGFLRELKRRRVLHTASLYVLGTWIALQVVEVLSGAGLPPSSMRNLLIILSFGFPLALIVGWIYDISMEGIVRTGPLKEDEQLPKLNFIDFILLAGLVLVVALDVYILSFPPSEDTQLASSTTGVQRTIAILGFDDLNEGSDPVGDVFAGELRSSLTRVAGLRVLGPETSKLLSLASDNRLVTAKELLVTAMVLGEVLLEGGQIQVSARLVGVPAGNEIWSTHVEAPFGGTPELQKGLLKQLVEAIAPSLDPDPVQGPRVEADTCADVYDLYLRGKQLSQKRRSEGDMRERGVELLREAVAINDQCAIAWEAIAVEAIDWSFAGFVKAGAAARRALELNDALPEAWWVLAEIAEQEERWSESEEYFLRALYADPTNARANEFYGEALVTRGRVRDGLHYALEAYRYEPASTNVNFHVSLAAQMAGDGDLTLKHATIFGDLIGKPQHSWVLSLMAGAYRLKGETDRELKVYADLGTKVPDWLPDCARVRDEPELAPGVLIAMQKTLEQFLSGTLETGQALSVGADLIDCGIWLGEPDVVFDVLLSEGVPPFEDGKPTEVIWINMFYPDSRVLRQDPRFRKLVVESGLLDYWRKWGWSDYCEPDGDSFRCD
jgi:TolB-like protein